MLALTSAAIWISRVARYCGDIFLAERYDRRSASVVLASLTVCGTNGTFLNDLSARPGSGESVKAESCGEDVRADVCVLKTGVLTPVAAR